VNVAAGVGDGRLVALQASAIRIRVISKTFCRIRADYTPKFEGCGPLTNCLKWKCVTNLGVKS
jgi:hypothetical protein